MIIKRIVAALFVALAGCVIYNADASEAPANQETEGAMSTATPSPRPAPPAQGVGGYCCDAVGVRRCVMPGFAPIGSACFCYGQGDGWVCP
jgi:hypothetical protein